MSDWASSSQRKSTRFTIYTLPCSVLTVWIWCWLIHWNQNQKLPTLSVQYKYNWYIVSLATRDTNFFLNLKSSYVKYGYRLKKTCTTRWFYWHKSIQKIKSRFEAILIVLDASSKCPPTIGAAEAAGFIIKMESFKFIFNFILLERILSHTQCLSLELQKETKNNINASNLIKCTEKQLKNLRKDFQLNL